MALPRDLLYALRTVAITIAQRCVCAVADTPSAVRFTKTRARKDADDLVWLITGMVHIGANSVPYTVVLAYNMHRSGLPDLADRETWSWDCTLLRIGTRTYLGATNDIGV